MTVLSPAVDFNQPAIHKEMLNQFNQFIAEFMNRKNVVLVGLERKTVWPLEECYLVWDLDAKMLDPIYCDVEDSVKFLCPALEVITPNATLDQVKEAFEEAKSENMTWATSILEAQISSMS